MRKRAIGKIKRKRVFPAIFALIFCLLIGTNTASATSYTVLGEGTTTPDGVLYDGQYSDPVPENATYEIGVFAKTSGSAADILYDVEVTYGDMQFVYDYGSYWNPTTHTYTPAEGGTGRQDGGWVQSYIGTLNDKIVINNLSNFPMTCSLSYSVESTALNDDPTAAGSVIGLFDEEAANLRDYDLLSEGKYGNSERSKGTYSAVLEMDHSGIDQAKINGSFYYYKDSLTGDTSKVVYFALSGKPDRGGPTTFTKVGTITIDIAPANSCTKVVISN